MPAKKAPAVHELIWERIARHTKADSGTLTADRIVRLAMEVADREGLEALSMRRIATELQSGVMSLYYYVPGKGELLDLVLDAAIGEVELPAQTSGDWQQDLRLLALRLRACLKSHPWAHILLNSRPAFGPNRLAQVEFVLGAVSALGLNHEAAWQATGLLFVYILGSVSLELSEAHALRRSEFEHTGAPYLKRLIATGKYPNLARYQAGLSPVPPDDDAFASGLAVVLQGIASLKKSGEERVLEARPSPHS